MAVTCFRHNLCGAVLYIGVITRRGYAVAAISRGEKEKMHNCFLINKYVNVAGQCSISFSFISRRGCETCT
jgi:hypothetical protein